MDKKKLMSNTLLLITAVIWGSAFVAQRVGMDYVGPFTFCASRFILATVFLVPVIYFMDRGKKAEQEERSLEEIALDKKFTLKGGFLCGLALFGGSILQQTGLVFTTAGKAGFITALYIVLIPIFSLALRRRPELKAWAGVVFGAVGLYLLSISESFTIAFGDLIVLIGAAFWAIQMLLVDHFLPKISDPIRLSLVQFAVCSTISTVGAFLFEEVSMDAIMQAGIPILYAGILSGGVGFTLQIVGQKYTNPMVASLILSLEAVFGAVFGFLLLQELLTTREIMGCLLMFVAIIISQLPDRKKPRDVASA